VTQACYCCLPQPRSFERLFGRSEFFIQRDIQIVLFQATK
jgi:hypothetical protein